MHCCCTETIVFFPLGNYGMALNGAYSKRMELVSKFLTTCLAKFTANHDKERESKMKNPQEYEYSCTYVHTLEEQKYSS